MQDKFKEIEKKRILAMITLLVSIALTIISVLIFFLFYIYASNNYLFILFAALAFVGYLAYFQLFKQFTHYYKLNFVANCLEDLFDNTQYYPNKCIAKSTIQEAHMVKVGNTFRGDDYLSGQYKGIDFTQSDLTIQHVTSNGKHTHTSTFFKGKWIYFDFNKDFKESVIIREKRGSAVMAGNVGDKIEFESADFNKEFRVYSDDQHTAFYLMTPQFLLSLRKLRDKTNGQLILGFVGGKLHIAIHSGKNALEPKIFTKIKESYIEEVRADMKVITDFIDELIADKPNYKIENSNEKTYVNIPVQEKPLFPEF